MSRTHTLNYLQNKNLSTYKILDALEVQIEERDNPYGLPLDVLFGMAARKNKKRGFLFVSKILGKHIPVQPAVSLLGGALLGARIIEAVFGGPVPGREKAVSALIEGKGAETALEGLTDSPYTLPEHTLFIGFAETATSLGHGVFDMFANASYIHTTRECIPELSSAILFEEEHSHAVSQACYGDPSLFKKDGPIVLVDDEITTGKTAINIIEAIHSQYPRKEYIVASLLDWRSEEDRNRYAELEMRLGIRISTVTLLGGEITVNGNPVEQEGDYIYPQPHQRSEPAVTWMGQDHFQEYKRLADLPYLSADSAGNVCRIPYSAMTGRFNGITDCDRADIDYFTRKTGELLRETRSGGRALCLGTGEFMYIPMKIAAFMGDDVYFQSTTRSPIHRVDREDYAVRSGFAFPCPDDPQVANHFYNIEYGQYREIFLFMERGASREKMEPLLQALKQTGPEHIIVVTLNEG